MRRTTVASTALALAIAALGAVLAWVLLQPSHWIPSAYDNSGRVAVLERDVVSLESQNDLLRDRLSGLEYQQRKQRRYIRAVWIFCFGFRSTRHWPESDNGVSLAHY